MSTMKPETIRTDLQTLLETHDDIDAVFDRGRDLKLVLKDGSTWILEIHRDD